MFWIDKVRLDSPQNFIRGERAHKNCSETAIVHCEKSWYLKEISTPCMLLDVQLYNWK